VNADASKTKSTGPASVLRRTAVRGPLELRRGRCRSRESPMRARCARPGSLRDLRRHSDHAVRARHSRREKSRKTHHSSRNRAADQAGCSEVKIGQRTSRPRRRGTTVRVANVHPPSAQNRSGTRHPCDATGPDAGRQAACTGAEHHAPHAATAHAAACGMPPDADAVAFAETLAFSPTIDGAAPCARQHGPRCPKRPPG